MSNPYAAPLADLASEADESEEHPKAPPAGPRPKAAHDAKFSEIARATDRIEAHGLVEMLESEGIPVMQSGITSGASIGAGESIVQIILSVPEGQADEARELVQAFREGLPAIEEDDDEPAAPRRSPMYVKVIAWFLFMPVFLAVVRILIAMVARLFHH